MRKPGKPDTALASSRPRVGDGVAVSVVKTLVPRPDGSTVMEAGFNLADAPVPSRRYHSDALDVTLDGESVVIIFGQRKVAGRGLRSLLAVHMPPDAVKRFLSSSSDFYDALAHYLTSTGAPHLGLTKFEEEPAQSVGVVANVVAAAQANREAVLDFFHISAWSIRDLREHATVGIDPIVRVDLTAPLMITLLDELKAIASRLPELTT